MLNFRIFFYFGTEQTVAPTNVWLVIWNTVALMWRLFIYAPTDDGDLQHSCTEEKKLEIVPDGKYGFETGICFGGYRTLRVWW